MPSRAQRTHRLVLRAAGRVLERTGFLDFTMAAVADEAGVSRQAVYDHFGSKSDLVVAASEHILDEARRRHGLAPLPAGASGLDALDHAIADYVRTVPSVHGVAVANDVARASDPAAQAAWANRTRVRRERYQRVFEQLDHDGRLRPEWTAKEAADLLFGLLSARMYEVLVIEGGWTVERYEQRVRRLVRDAVLDEAGAAVAAAPA
ncbi:MAG: helix-turn-helix domain-containing protein [Trueperaceae bacterium]|nr:helix-turn-helix domain-containing protein [Trueperaceae bacterium]